MHRHLSVCRGEAHEVGARHQRGTVERPLVATRWDRAFHQHGDLTAERVVTLTGTGGIGKTAVAEAVSALWRRRHGGEARFVSFEEVTAQGLAAAVGQVVGTSATATIRMATSGASSVTRV